MSSVTSIVPEVTAIVIWDVMQVSVSVYTSIVVWGEKSESYDVDLVHIITRYAFHLPGSSHMQCLWLFRLPLLPTLLLCSFVIELSLTPGA